MALIRRCNAHFTGYRTSLRDMVKLKYKADDLSGFKESRQAQKQWPFKCSEKPAKHLSDTVTTLKKGLTKQDERSISLFKADASLPDEDSYHGVSWECQNCADQMWLLKRLQRRQKLVTSMLPPGLRPSTAMGSVFPVIAARLTNQTGIAYPQPLFVIVPDANSGRSSGSNGRPCGCSFSTSPTLSYRVSIKKCRNMPEA